MVRVVPAPDWKKSFHMGSQRLAALLTEMPERQRQVEALADTRDDYLHWTRFRFAEPFPQELSREEGWFLVRIARMARAIPLPFRGKNGKNMVVCLTDPLHAAVRRITAHRELLRAGLPEQPNARDAEDMKSFGLKALIDEAYYSAVIEGAVTTRREARRMIREQLEPRDRSEWMILNNYRAGEKMVQWAEEPMTPERLCEIQETLTAHTLESESDCGRFRTDPVQLCAPFTGEVVYVPPPPEEIRERVQRLCAFANDEDRDDRIPPFVRACLLHYQLAYDHPFGDGNGRTARWLFLWGLLRCPEYWWVAMLSVSRMTKHSQQAYYDAFRYAELDDFDTTYLVRHQTRAFEREMARFVRFLERRQDLGAYARKRLRLGEDLNQRQVALFDRLRKAPEDCFTQRGHARFHGVSQPTARKDLETLVSWGLLARETGRPILYHPTPRFRAAARGYDRDGERD